MLQLVFIACTQLSLLQGGYCKEYRIEVMADKVTQRDCEFNGMVMLARWSANNVGWQIHLSRDHPLRCELSDQFAKLKFN